MTRRFLHVANGTCTTTLIEAAKIPGLRSIWADPLYEGPVPAALSDRELREVRAKYLAGNDGQVEPHNDLLRWRQVIEAVDAYDELLLWYEHDLFDQLNLIQVLSWLPMPVRVAVRASLVSIAAYPGHPRFKGLGELSPAEIASLVDKRRPIGTAEFVIAEAAWQLFREPTPQPLDDFRRSRPAVFPHLIPSLDRFVQEYPWTIDGLSRSERRLLSLVAAGPTDLRSAFPHMHDDESHYYITDLSLAALADTLARTSPPLLRVEAAPGSDGTRLANVVTLTAAGREVLEGRRDRVGCGLDRWLGGVHLHEGGVEWRWDEDQQRVVRM